MQKVTFSARDRAKLPAKLPAKLNVAVRGCGFMGRTHSNAFGKVGNFFDVKLRPVLKAVCARNTSSARAFADQ